MGPTDALTVAALAAAGRHLIVRCDDCDWSRTVLPDVLSVTFGDDFNVVANIAELRSRLRCDRCGRRHRSVVLSMQIHEPVSRLTRRRA